MLGCRYEHCFDALSHSHAVSLTGQVGIGLFFSVGLDSYEDVCGDCFWECWLEFGAGSTQMRIVSVDASVEVCATAFLIAVVPTTTELHPQQCSLVFVVYGLQESLVSNYRNVV